MQVVDVPYREDSVNTEDFAICVLDYIEMVVLDFN